MRGQAQKKEVLVLCHDTVGKKMAGPGIRYQNLAKQISKIAKVKLAMYTTSQARLPAGVTAIKTTGESYQAVFDKAEVIFAQWLPLHMLQYAKANGKIVIIDLYAPVPIEHLASLGFSKKKLGEQQDAEFKAIIETYQQYLGTADLFVCSNERQRDFWLGFITASGLIKPSNFKAHANQDNFILAPMGIDAKAARAKELKLRKQAGLSQDDFVLLWSGGIWDWFDAQVIIRAIKQLNIAQVKLVFLGTKHPNTKVYKEEMPESQAARALADKLKLTNKSVFFFDGWVPYEERARYLLDANAAIHADKPSVETRLSHRTRVLDNLWAGLPTICAQGDYFAEVLATKHLGIVVKQRTPQAFAAAIKQAYQQPDLLKQIGTNIAKERPHFTWKELTQDLCAFIKQAQPKPITANVAAAPKRTLVHYGGLAKTRVKGALKVLLGRSHV